MAGVRRGEFRRRRTLQGRTRGRDTGGAYAGRAIGSVDLTAQAVNLTFFNRAEDAEQCLA